MTTSPIVTSLNPPATPTKRATFVRHGVKSLFPASESYFLDRAGNEPLQATCWALVHLFQLQLQSYPLTLYHMDGGALHGVPP
jgi:hypothetical protein